MEPGLPGAFLPPSGVARPGPVRRERSRGFARLRAAPHGPSAPPGGAVGATLRAAGREFRRRRRRRERAEGSRPGAGRAWPERATGGCWGRSRSGRRGAARRGEVRCLRMGPPGRDRPRSPGSFLCPSLGSRRLSPVPDGKAVRFWGVRRPPARVRRWVPGAGPQGRSRVSE